MAAAPVQSEVQQAVQSDHLSSELQTQVVGEDVACNEEEDEEEEDEEEEEVVAVGSVAHVLQRAFHTFYSPPTDQIAQVVSTEGCENDGGQEASTLPNEDAISANAATLDPPNDTGSESDASTSLPLTPRIVSDGNEMPAVDIAQHTSNPFVVLGLEKKRAIKEELRNDRARANQLLHFLDERQVEAKRIDAEVEEQLRRQGLIAKEQIPLGPSPLKLDEREVASPEFGSFPNLLLHAKTIVTDYHRQRLERSGNLPKKSSQNKVANSSLSNLTSNDNERTLGYLDSTDSAAIRTEATLKLHERRIAGVKTLHASINSSVESTQPATDKSAVPIDPSSTAPIMDRGCIGVDDNIMPAGDKRANMAILNRMQTKLDFMRNPRYAETTRSDKDDAHSFTVDPKPPITFTEYDIGGIYEQKVFVRNRTALSRRLRVLPPATLFFSVSEVIFPDSSGLVAPGMHVEVRLRFAPDSRADYRDALTVQYEAPSGTEGGSSSRTLLIPLEARREPPELTIPLVLRAKNTLLGDISRAEIACANSGGAGTFWLMTEQEWTRFEAKVAFRGTDAQSPGESSEMLAAVAAATEPNATAWNFQVNESLRAGPFRLSPTRMALAKGGATTLLLDYAPASVGEHRERIVMVCDNCLVRVFQLVGRGCQVDLAVTAINDTRIDRSIATMGSCDRVFFEPGVFVGSVDEQKVSIANETPIDVKYSWKIVPLSNEKSSRNLPIDPPFQVLPIHGVFEASSSTIFTVQFSPTSPLSSIQYTAVLNIEDVPGCSLPGPKQRGLLSAALQHTQQFPVMSAIAYKPWHERAVEGLHIELSGSSKLGEFAIEPLVWDFAKAGGMLQKDAVHTAQVRIKNLSPAPIQFKLDPNAWRRECRLPPSATAPLNLSIHPSEGLLEPGSELTATIEFTPHCSGPFSISIPCVTPINDHTFETFGQSILLVGEVERSKVEIVSPEVDFGLVLAGGSSETTIAIRNPSPIAVAEWKFAHLGDASELRSLGKGLPHSASKESVVSQQSAVTSVGNETDRSGASSLATGREASPTATVAFAPEAGRLAPGEALTIRAKCLAGALPERFRATLACQVIQDIPFPKELTRNAVFSATGSGSMSVRGLDNTIVRSAPSRIVAIGSTPAITIMASVPPPTVVYVSARAEIQSPNIFLSTTKLALGATYLGVTVHLSLELINVSNLEASFKFAEPEASGSLKPYSLEIMPNTGVIHSKERLKITLTYTARQAGRFTSLIACNVRGLLAPLGFEINSVHKGLVLSYELIEDLSSLSTTPFSSIKPPSSRDLSCKESNESSTASLPIPPPPRLAFGDSVPLGERRALIVLIRNLSGIEAALDLEVKKFPIVVICDNGGNPSRGSPQSSSLRLSPKSRKSNSSSSRSMRVSTTNTSASPVTSHFGTRKSGFTNKSLLLSDTHEHPGRLQSESGRAYAARCAEALEDRKLLGHGHGVAFRLEPSTLQIAPWGHAVVRVVCFNNKPGSYVDEIVVRAAGLPPVMLPALVTVTGVPLVLDRNCVGLVFPKQIKSHAPSIPAVVSSNKKKRTLDITGEEYPTLRFGQVCIRSQGLVTRSLRVINRSPQRARLTWRLASPGCENHVVSVSLRVDFAARVQVQVTPIADRNAPTSGQPVDGNDDDDNEDAFTVSPPSAVIAPFATVSFRVTLRRSEEIALHRLMLVADAKWLDTESVSTSMDLEQPGDDPYVDGDHFSNGQVISPVRDQRSESPRAEAARTAAGKAIAAVRMANTLTRHQPSWRTHGLGAIDSGSNVTKNCIRVLLAADVIDPELFLDKPKRADANALVQANANGNYHVTFTTWSTIIGSNASSFAAAAMHEFHRREIQLINHFQTPLTFRLECSGPFVVFRAESLAPKHPLSIADLSPAHRRTQGESFMFSLPPQMAVRLELRFDPTLMAQPPVLPSLSSPQQLRSMINGELHVRFSNQTVQSIRLGTCILLPMLVVSPAAHAFGHVHITQQRVVTLRVVNPTVVPAQFNVEHVPLPTPLSRAQKQEFAQHYSKFSDDPKVFSFSITSGVVHGPTLPLQAAGGLLPFAATKNSEAGGIQTPLEISVTFRPRESGKHYRSRFRLAVVLGHAFEVVMEGIGHLDEREFDDQQRPLVRAGALTHSHRIFTRL